MVKLLSLLCLVSFCACTSSNTNSNNANKDTLGKVLSADESIVTYADSLELIKQNLQKTESPVFNQGDYNFYFVSYQKDSLPLIYEEYATADNYGFNNKTYYLQDGELVLYREKSKQTIIGDKPSFEFKEQRIFYRNAIFLKADERSAESDSLISAKPFLKIDETLNEKNKFYDFRRIEKGLKSSGEFALGFDKIIATNPSKKVLVLNSSYGIQSSYQIKTPDSLIMKLEETPEIFKGTKLNINYSRQGNSMIYKGERLAN